MAETIKIAGELESVATDGKVADIANIKDKTQGDKSQAEINAETEIALGDRYTKEETYSKEELNSLITTPSTNYENVEATEETTDVTDVLPAPGEANTVYRVGSWDGTQYDVTCYSEYAWKGDAYIHLSTKSQIGEVFDISAYHATGGELATYADLAAALDSNNGGGVPQSLQKGGMSVKFVRSSAQSSDNKYVQYRLMLSEFTAAQFTNVSNWQGVDNILIRYSKNVIESGAVAEEFNEINTRLDGTNGEILLVDSITIHKTGWISEVFTSQGNIVVSIKTPNIPNRTIVAVFNDANKEPLYPIDEKLPLDGKEHLYPMNIEEQPARLVFGPFENGDLSQNLLVRITKAEDIVHDGEFYKAISSIDNIEFGSSQYSVLSILNTTQSSISGNLTITGEESHIINIANLSSANIAEKIGNESFTGYTLFVSENVVIFRKDVPEVSDLTFDATGTGLQYNYTITSNAVAQNLTGLENKYKKDGLILKTKNEVLTSVNILKNESVNEFVDILTGNDSPSVVNLNILQDNEIYTGTDWFGEIFSSAKATFYVIPLPYNLYKKILVQASSNKETNFAFVKEWYDPINGYNFVQCKDSTINTVSTGNSGLFEVPSDCKYIVIAKSFNLNETVRTPQFVKCSLINTIDTKIKDFGKSKVIKIAAYNAPYSDKLTADIVCTGINDEIAIQRAMNMACDSCTLLFSEGNFKIDAFYTYSHAARPTALFIGKLLKSLNFCGTEKNRWENLTVFDVDMTSVENDAVSFILGSDNAGRNTRQVNMSNITVNLSTWEKPVIAIDCQFFDASIIKKVSVRTHHWTDRPIISEFPEPSVGIRGFDTNNNGFGLRFIDNFVIGFKEGFQIAGEHIIMMECLGYSCHWAYSFGNFTPYRNGVWEHPITLINCSEESCDCLPLFANCGYFNNGAFTQDLGLQNITMIDHTIEQRSTNPSREPLQPAEELNPGKFCGSITFTVNQTYAQNKTDFQFWKAGSGHNFDTRNSTHAKGGTSALRATYSPMYMQHYYDTDLNKELVYDGTNWRDCVGNIIQ